MYSYYNLYNFGETISWDVWMNLDPSHIAESVFILKKEAHSSKIIFLFFLSS